MSWNGEHSPSTFHQWWSRYRAILNSRKVIEIKSFLSICFKLREYQQSKYSFNLIYIKFIKWKNNQYDSGRRSQLTTDQTIQKTLNNQKRSIGEFNNNLLSHSQTIDINNLNKCKTVTLAITSTNIYWQYWL